MSDHGPVDPNCLNCGTELHGTYCSSCGQKATSLAVKLHDFAHEATHEFLHLDGKIVNTMKLLLFRPGLLTREFLDGRRVRYISPIRLYLTWSVLFFALATMVPQVRQSFFQIKDSKPRRGVAVSTSIPRLEPAARMTPERKQAEAKADEIGSSLMHQLPRAMFLLMPIFALLTWVVYRRQEPYYIPHLYNAIHFHAFAFFVLVLTVSLGAMGGVGKAVGSLLFLTTFPYHYIALRRVFGGTRAATFAKGTVIGLIYWFVVAAAVAGLAYLAVRGAGH
jgi:hypothetical protein